MCPEDDRPEAMRLIQQESLRRINAVLQRKMPAYVDGYNSYACGVNWDHSLLVFVSSYEKTCFYDLKNDRILKEYTLEANVSNIAFHPEKKLVAVSNTMNGNYLTYGQLRLLDYEKDKATPVFNHDDDAWGVEYSEFLNDNMIRVIMSNRDESDPDYYLFEFSYENLPVKLNPDDAIIIEDMENWKTEWKENWPDVADLLEKIFPLEK